MDARDEKGSHFTTGFLLGLLLGVSITLLLVTRKGRKILKTLSDEGFENIRDWQSRLQNAQATIDDDFYEEDVEEGTDVRSETAESTESTEKSHGNGVKKHKKLFRGIPKKAGS